MSIVRINLEDRLRESGRRQRIRFGVLVAVALTLLFLALYSSAVSVSAVGVSRSLPSRRATSAEARLSARLKRPAADLSRAISERQQLLRKSLTIRFVSGTGSAVSIWRAAVSEHPSWVTFVVGMDGKGSAQIDAERVEEYFQKNTPSGLGAAKSCTVLSKWTDDQGVLRAQTSCIAESGYAFDAAEVARTVVAALAVEADSVDIWLEPEAATIVDVDYGKDGTLTLLATGRSTFKGSGESRKSNVRRAINERENNIIVPEGDVFSFNATLGGPVTLSRGWQMALTIFEGGELRPAPGGGICQASTTMFRAALRAGLPIVERRSHSLFVSYYEAHGVGQDATIFYGHQNLRFLNDTGGPIVIQSFTRGDEAFVQIFGKDDGRRVALQGPYFAKTAPAGFEVNGRKVRGSEIVWLREVEKDGVVVTKDTFVSAYKQVPKKLAEKYAPTMEVTREGTVDVAERVEVAVGE